MGGVRPRLNCAGLLNDRWMATFRPERPLANCSVSGGNVAVCRPSASGILERPLGHHRYSQTRPKVVLGFDVLPIAGLLPRPVIRLGAEHLCCSALGDRINGEERFLIGVTPFGRLASQTVGGNRLPGRTGRQSFPERHATTTRPLPARLA